MNDNRGKILIYNNPETLLAWATQQAAVLRKGLGNFLVRGAFDSKTDVMTTREGCWATYPTLGLTITSPVFVEEQTRYRLEGLDLHFLMRVGLKVPGVVAPELPLEGHLTLPVVHIPPVHVDLCLKRLH